MGTNLGALLKARSTDTSLELILQDVRDEFFRATSKFGEYNSPHEGYAVIHEELDELWDEVKGNKGYTGEARAEAIQVAVTAIRYVYDLHKR